MNRVYTKRRKRKRRIGFYARSNVAEEEKKKARKPTVFIICSTTGYGEQFAKEKISFSGFMVVGFSILFSEKVEDEMG